MIGKTRHSPKHLEEVFDSGLLRAQGLLRWPPADGQFRHERRHAPDDLTCWIESFWRVDWDLERPHCQESLPHPCFHLVFEAGRCTVQATTTGLFTRMLEGRSAVFGIKFRPGGFRPFLGAPAATFTNRSIEAGALFGAAAAKLESDLAAASWQTDRMIEAASAFFRARCRLPDPKIQETDEMVRLIMGDRSILTAEDLARRTATGVRQLQRLFREYVGVSPKWVIRRYRLHEIVELLNSGGRPDWSRVAVDLGYFDQAHLINDFKSIVGGAPSQYRRS